MLNEASAVFAMPTWDGVCKEPSNLPSIKMLEEDERLPVALMFLLSTVEKRSGFLVFPLFAMNSPDQYGVTMKKPSECNVLKAFILPEPGVGCFRYLGAFKASMSHAAFLSSRPGRNPATP